MQTLYSTTDVILLLILCELELGIFHTEFTGAGGLGKLQFPSQGGRHNETGLSIECTSERKFRYQIL